MPKKILAVVLILASSIASAVTQKIAAIVNTTPITFQELDDRKKLLLFFHESQGKNITMHVNQMALNGLIDEILFLEQANKFRIKISAEEIDNVIANLEQQNKMSPGTILNKIKSQNIPEYTFKNQIASQLIRDKIVTGFLVHGITTGKEEVNSTIVTNNVKDVKVNLMVVSSKNRDKATYEQMQKLRKKIKNCEPIPQKTYSSFASLSMIESELSKLPADEQLIVKGLNTEKESNVLLVGDCFKIFTLCNHEIVGLTEEENAQIINIIGNKKLSTKTKKYYDLLRRKAYIEVLDNR